MADLERARAAYAERSWREAYEAFVRADGQGPLEAEDLELFTTSARMRGLDAEAPSILERAHHRYLERGEVVRAAYCAGWIGMSLAYQGAAGQAAGWLARAERLLEDVTEERAEHGYLLLPLMFRQEAAGEFDTAAETAGRAAEMGKRHGDLDLFVLALHARGQMLISAGRVPDGLACLDEAMVTVTTADLSPFVVGLVYCGVIIACNHVFEVGRAREWTVALTEWTEAQKDIVAFTGRCLVHRAEILQLSGSWDSALEEARLATKRLVETRNTAAGLARYREGELLRLAGEFDAADESYREASRLGWEPQPGLAQLRLAQGKLEAALAAIRRACAETVESLKRVALLPAYVEIALAAGETEEARTACDELRELAQSYGSPMVDAMLGHAHGAVALAAGETQSALASLRETGRIWLELDAPYEIARTRVLVSRACAQLGDAETAALELEAAREIFERLGAAPDLAQLAGRKQDAHGLSQRELEVLRLVASGKTNRDIASTLVISEHTVARHVQNTFRKIGVSSRSAATAYAFENDLV
jgi:ATP/maltotriose-dependent transcriptional regulator MalT